MVTVALTIDEVFELLQAIHLDERSDEDLIRAYTKLHSIVIKEEK